MNYSKAMDAPIPVDDLLKDRDGLVLWEAPALFNFFGEVSPVAKLSDDAGVGFEVKDVVEFNDVMSIFEEF